MELLLEARQLERRDDRHLRVAGIDLRLHRGEVIGLLGVNGAGKSTTLSLLSGALRPSSGSVSVLGRDLYRYPRETKPHIGLLSDRPFLYPELSVDENLSYAAAIRGIPRQSIPAARDRVKTQCDLGAVGRRLAGQLSRGFAQRLGIAQALIHKPDILFLDEPTLGLDPGQTAQFRELIRDLAEECGIILASHLLPDIEQLCGRALILEQGRPLAEYDLKAERYSHIRVHFHGMPRLQQLTQLPGIAEAHPLEAGWIQLLVDNPPADLAERIAALGWGLSAYVPGGRDLQQLFNRLATRGDSE